ncbi:MAG: phospholipid carrier-dependent glycosyltransferase [Sphingobacteriales bacterium]|nr:MAG: phospholipid carrier-dependent glycosyltransferase [Sphingobacteriales bacterium]
MRLPGWLWSLFAILVLAIPIFACLDTLPIQLWDESRLAINAYELYKSKQWLVTTYNNAPDFWNTKPPLLIWIQVVFFNFFGVNELALRLPSAIAGGLTCLTIFWFLKDKAQKPALGVLAVIVLVSSTGFIKYHHSPRTGDYDAMLTFFSVTYSILYFRYLDKDKRYLLLLSLCFVTLAVMTKTIAGLLMAPGLVLYTIYKKKLLTTLKAPQFYIGLAIFAGVVAGYYYMHEQRTPGYFRAVVDNDLIGRFAKSSSVDGYMNRDFFYYINLAIDQHFHYWYLLALVGAIGGCFSVNSKIKDVTIFSLLLSLSYFVIISKSVNKSDWYDMQAYPFLAVLAAIGIWFICQMLLKIDFSNLTTKKPVFLFAAVAALTVTPYLASMNSSLNPTSGDWVVENTNICSYLKDVYQNPHMATDSVVVVKDKRYMANIEWYLKVLRDKGKFTQIAQLSELDKHSRVVVFQPAIKDTIRKYYQYDTVESKHPSVSIYQLKGRK